MRMKTTAAAAVLAAALLAGCSSTNRTVHRTYQFVDASGVVYEDVEDHDLIETTYDAVDTMLSRSRAGLKSDQKVLTSTFVNLANMEETRDFGRLVGEFAAARLTQRKISAMNLNVRDESLAIIQRAGQFVQSRDMEQLSSRYDAEAALIGTYTRAGSSVFVTMRLVMLRDSTIAASVDYELPLGPKTRALLGLRTSLVATASHAEEEHVDSWDWRSRKAN